MAKLFETTTINGMTLQNHLVRSATWEGMCEQNGKPTEKVVSVYRELTKGGTGLIITGYAFVRPEGKQLPGQMGIHTDAFAGDYENLTAAVHDAGGKVALQIVHAGGETDADTAGRQPLAPSAVKVDQFPETPVELSKDEISDIVAAFGKGAQRSKAWGFDAVQLHGAHGFLINQFLSPLTNRRTDEYGGNVENRCRFMLEAYDKVRETIGADYPVLIKLNAADYVDGGLEIDDALYAARKLSGAGIDAIEISTGTPASGEKGPVRGKINKPEREAYNLDLARKIKTAVGCPGMVVGGFRSYAVAEKAIGDDGMDFVSMARPLIREPDLPNRWLQGDRSPARCISCNKCFTAGIEKGGIYCVVEKKEREKAANK
ncbi:MAG: NADH:flavin oxidoreductase [Desulfosarcina sp.]|nr:NADH:flavin oxidoreductase [Desulfobacterales bacterium]